MFIKIVRRSEWEKVQREIAHLMSRVDAHSEYIKEIRSELKISTEDRSYSPTVDLKEVVKQILKRLDLKINFIPRTKESFVLLHRLTDD